LFYLEKSKFVSLQDEGPAVHLHRSKAIKPECNVAYFLSFPMQQTFTILMIPW